MIKRLEALVLESRGYAEEARKEAKEARKEAKEARKEAEEARKDAERADNRAERAENRAAGAENKAEEALKEAEDANAKVAHLNKVLQAVSRSTFWCTPILTGKLPLLPQHSRIIHPLHRRFVLDSARDKIRRKYEGKIDANDLYPLSMDVDIGATPRAASRILQSLDRADTTLLRQVGVEAIISTGKGTLRGDGNEAAHQATEIEASDAVLASNLLPSQREIMNAVHKYTFGSDPNLAISEFQ
jgi:hypothetical protein